MKRTVEGLKLTTPSADEKESLDLFMAFMHRDEIRHYTESQPDILDLAEIFLNNHSCIETKEFGKFFTSSPIHVLGGLDADGWEWRAALYTNGMVYVAFKDGERDIINLSMDTTTINSFGYPSPSSSVE